jgi:DNA-binding HxlR family transcriptional regulator
MSGFPVELALDIVGGKWKMPMLWRLDRCIWRYGDLKSNLGTITHKMLSQQLRELERDGLITRKAHAEVPPRVEYSITPLGKTTLPIIEALRTWGGTCRRRAPREGDLVASLQ